MTIGDSVKIEAEKATGAYWGVISALQILKQNKTTIPKGITRDYPKYEVRGFMLDVGRKAFDFNTVKEFAKNMAWYKMNNFHLHLSDNLIFLEDYATIDEAVENAYAGFRLESEIPNLTSEDTYYTKKRSSVLSLKTAEPWVSTSFRNLICRHMPWRSQEPSRTL